MEIAPQIFTAKVMHKRLFPKVNQFTYGVYYLAVPLSHMETIHDGWRLGHNRRALLSLHDKDHGAKDGSDGQRWIGTILREHGFTDEVRDVMLIAMPRVLGYVFNPVSFWLCLDTEGAIRAVLSEVNNTFGETHSYLCAHADHRAIGPQEWMVADKQFHVSPFLERKGEYHFRFSLHEKRLGIWIDYYHENGQKQLLTALTGEFVPLTRTQLRYAFWRHPLVTLRTIFLIHWQAMKLVSRGIRYIAKPPQLSEKFSRTRNITKM